MEGGVWKWAGTGVGLNERVARGESYDGFRHDVFCCLVILRI